MGVKKPDLAWMTGLTLHASLQMGLLSVGAHGGLWAVQMALVEIVQGRLQKQVWRYCNPKATLPQVLTQLHSPALQIMPLEQTQMEEARMPCAARCSILKHQNFGPLTLLMSGASIMWCCMLNLNLDHAESQLEPQLDAHLDAEPHLDQVEPHLEHEEFTWSLP